MSVTTPDTVSVFFASETVTAEKVVEVKQFSASADYTGVGCQLQPMKASAAFDQTNLTLSNPYRVLANLADADKFKFGAKLIATAGIYAGLTFVVVEKPRKRGQFADTSHVVMTAEEREFN